MPQGDRTPAPGVGYVHSVQRHLGPGRVAAADDGGVGFAAVARDGHAGDAGDGFGYADVRELTERIGRQPVASENGFAPVQNERAKERQIPRTPHKEV